MTRFRVVSPWILAAALLLAASAAEAQRNGNVWDGKSHEPDAGAVHSQERAAGVLPAPERQKALDDEVDTTANKLLNNRPGPSVPGSPVRP